MNVFFYKESKSKKNLFLCLGREWGGGGARDSKIFFYKESKSKKQNYFFGVGGGGAGVGGGD